MPGLKDISLDEFASRRHREGGTDYAKIVSDFMESGKDVAEVDPEDKSPNTISQGLRIYLKGRDIPVAVASWKDGKGEDATERVALCRRDTEVGKRYAPKVQGPRKAKGSATAAPEAPQAEATEGEGDPFDALEATNA